MVDNQNRKEEDPHEKNVYTYTDRNNYLASLEYGNEDSVQYTYDQQGRVTQQTYEDGSTVTYKYDNSGALASITDSASGITSTYYYDFTDRLLRYVETGTGYNHSIGYEYDTINNLTALVETINGTEFRTAYTYDDDNRVTGITSGDASESYAYDDYSRLYQKVTAHDGTTVLTDTFTYRSPTESTTSGQVWKLTTDAAHYDVTYTYTYDANGNITSVSAGDKTTTYTYDSANQVIREDNQAAGYTHVWTYDNAGNILNRKEYAYTTGTLGAVQKTVTYAYGDTAWGDLLTKYDGTAITYDEIGNPLTDGTWTYDWEHGRQLKSMSNGSTTWAYTYNADGLRTKRTDGTTTYQYVYNGGSLSQMTVGSNTLYFAYDASGSPMSVTYNGTTYYYALNLQGDVMAILNASGTAVVTYTYNAWGKILTTSGTMASTLGKTNALTYRGYVYDHESGLYYLQSRYYNPEQGRFINADALVSTGQGILGHNMFAYCGNNPVNFRDSSGNAFADTQSQKSIICIDDGCGAAGGATAGILFVLAIYIDSLEDGAKRLADEIKTWVERTTKIDPSEKRDQSVYIMRSIATGEVKYVGRTNDPIRRQYEHSRDSTKKHLYPLEVVLTGLTVSQAQLVEQLLISAYTINELENHRREIASSRLGAFDVEIKYFLALQSSFLESELMCLLEGK